MTLEQRLNAIAGNLIIGSANRSNIENAYRELVRKFSKSNEFSDLIKGGSFQRNKAVSGLSDLDVYVRYLGNNSPHSVLGRLQHFLEKEYSSNSVRLNPPSITLDTNKITFEITPYSLQQYGNQLIPSRDLQNWIQTDTFELRNDFRGLSGKSNTLNNAIILLKSWNSKSLKLNNYEIEKRLYSQFKVNNNLSVSQYILSFFKGGGFNSAAYTFQELIDNQNSDHYPMNQKLNSFFGIQ